MSVKIAKELSLEFESVNMLIKAQNLGMIVGGDEGKLHLLDNNLKWKRTTYIGACLHAGITHNGNVYVSVKNDSYKL